LGFTSSSSSSSSLERFGFSLAVGFLDVVFCLGFSCSTVPSSLSEAKGSSEIFFLSFGFPFPLVDVVATFATGELLPAGLSIGVGAGLFCPISAKKASFNS
jgi:hypothetical protein